MQVAQSLVPMKNVSAGDHASDIQSNVLSARGLNYKVTLQLHIIVVRVV